LCCGRTNNPLLRYNGVFSAVTNAAGLFGYRFGVAVADGRQLEIAHPLSSKIGHTPSDGDERRPPPAHVSRIRCLTVMTRRAAAIQR
jgi:hypothetical protein